MGMCMHMHMYLRMRIYLRITQSQAIFQPGRLRIAIEDRRELWVKTRPLWAIAGGRRLGPSRLARASLSGSGGSGGSGGSSGSSGLWGGGLNLCRPNAGGRPLPLIAICSSGSVDALARPIEGHAHGFRSLGRWSRARWWCRPTILLHPTTVCHVALHDSNPAATVAPANGGCNVKCTAAHSISQQQKCQKGGRHVAPQTARAELAQIEACRPGVESGGQPASCLWRRGDISATSCGEA
jgi:hypothetical protein